VRIRQDRGERSGPLDLKIPTVTVLARGGPNGTLQLVVQIPRPVRKLLNRRLGSQGVEVPQADHELRSTQGEASGYR
jgi:hypothetical protein